MPASSAARIRSPLPGLVLIVGIGSGPEPCSAPAPAAAVTQLTPMAVTFASTTLPEPLVTEQSWPLGWAAMLTLKLAPLARAVAKAKLPLAGTARRSLPLLSSIRPAPMTPCAVPPTCQLAAALGPAPAAGAPASGEPSPPPPQPARQQTRPATCAE